MMLRMKKVKMLIFDIPPLQNQDLFVPMVAKTEPPRCLEPNIMAINNDGT